MPVTKYKKAEDALLLALACGATVRHRRAAGRTSRRTVYRRLRARTCSAVRPRQQRGCITRTSSQFSEWARTKAAISSRCSSFKVRGWTRSSAKSGASRRRGRGRTGQGCHATRHRVGVRGVPRFAHGSFRMSEECRINLAGSCLREWDRGAAKNGERLPQRPALAERVIASVPGGANQLLYGRVDLLPTTNEGAVVTEVELIEPSLFFGHRPDSADQLAELIARAAARAW